MSVFESILKKYLHKSLPQSQDYVISRRIEGALVRSEESTYHEHVTIIIDSGIDKDDYETLSELICNVIRRDMYYKWSKYRIILWRSNDFTMVSRPKIQVSHVKDCMKEINFVNGNNGTWEEFWELYKPHKKAGQVILVTSAQRIESLKETTAGNIKNLVIVYCGDSGNKLAQKIHGIPCIPYVKQNGENTSDDSEETI